MTDYTSYVGANGKVLVIQVLDDDRVRSFAKLDPSVVEAHLVANPTAIPLLPAEADKYDGTRYWTYADDTLTQEDAPTPTLGILKVSALRRVDSEAERARMLWLTPGYGQAVEYEATLSEALRAKGAEDPYNALTVTTPAPLDDTNFPWLNAELNAQAAVGNTVSLTEAADIVLAAHTAWLTAGVEIKEIRRTAKLQIAESANQAAIDAIIAGLSWPTP